MNLQDVFSSIYDYDNKDTIKISYYVIKYCNDKKIDITNLKLIKLLYFINIKYMLENNGKPLFTEKFLAWRHGPVIQSVYNFFCYGLILPNEKRQQVLFNSIDIKTKKIIDKVLDKKASQPVWDLVEETHVIGGPWYNTYNKYKDKDGICKKEISYKEIYNFYKEYNNGISNI